MKNKSIKIKMVLAGGFLALCLSIGSASNEALRSNLTGALFGAAEDTYQRNEQEAQERESTGESDDRSVPPAAEKPEGEGKISTITGESSDLEAKEYIAYLAEQQNQASEASRGSSIRAAAQNQDVSSRSSNQSESSTSKNQNAASPAGSETAELPPSIAETQEDNKAQADNKTKDLGDAGGSANSSGTNTSDANTSSANTSVTNTSDANTSGAAAAEADASRKAESGKEDETALDQELDLLARLITAEAQGEPYEAQVAVGAVVLNRVKSGVWPDSVREVIYHNVGGYYQFTPVVNGWIDKPAQASCIKAAKAALSGADPTKGAQFYYDDSTTNEWILSKTVSIKIGHMIFAF